MTESQTSSETPQEQHTVDPLDRMVAADLDPLDKDPIDENILPETSKAPTQPIQQTQDSYQPQQPQPDKVTYMRLIDRIESEIQNEDILTVKQVKSRMNFIKSAPKKLRDQLIPSTMSVGEVMAKYQKPIIENTKGLTVQKPIEDVGDYQPDGVQEPGMTEEVIKQQAIIQREELKEKEERKKKYPLEVNPGLRKILQDLKVHIKPMKKIKKMWIVPSSRKCLHVLNKSKRKLKTRKRRITRSISQ